MAPIAIIVCLPFVIRQESFDLCGSAYTRIYANGKRAHRKIAFTAMVPMAGQPCSQISKPHMQSLVGDVNHADLLPVPSSGVSSAHIGHYETSSIISPITLAGKRATISLLKYVHSLRTLRPFPMCRSDLSMLLVESHAYCASASFRPLLLRSKNGASPRLHTRSPARASL